jgi:predicted Zn finger-like uncharacterized protein
MLIVCPSCATSYDLAPTSLSPNGRQVRCARCRTVWHAQMSHADKLLHAAAALAPAEEDRRPRLKRFSIALLTNLPALVEPVRRSLDEQMLRRALDEQTVDASIAAIGGRARLRGRN